jgi:hypothetical protein
MEPSVIHSIPSTTKNIILIGTIGKSSLIDQLIKEKKIDIGAIKKKWEAYLVQLITKPFKGVDKALIIVGSDVRDAAYGVFQLSREIEVSHWY